MNLWNDFHGPNAAYVLDLYDQYQADPTSVDAETRAYFEQWTPSPPPVAGDGFGRPGELEETLPVSRLEDTLGGDETTKVFLLVNYAQAIRDHGHLGAQLDPLGREPTGDPSLDMANHGLTEEDLRDLPAYLVGGPIGKQSANAWEAIQTLQQVYCSTTGYDFVHVRAPEERSWLREVVESGKFTVANDPIDDQAMLDALTKVETFEHFIHRSFPGKTRFSIEGLDMMVPILNEMLVNAIHLDIRRILVGMAHRGRLNVLTHVLQKPYKQILAEFKDPVEEDYATYHENLGWTGDVKYHTGASMTLDDGDKMVDLEITMAPNPSHLEHVNPVVVGMARAAGTSVNQAGSVKFDRTHSVPILIHGDAAFPGQGIVSETFNMYRLPGYQVGGTLHLIANNQIGFTTDPQASRSTVFASDLAKGFKIPIVRVNADDPEACITVARMAVAYLAKFKKDFVIDLIGYRRYGHNEGDEPRFTQPLLYDIVENHPTVRQLWADKLVERGVVETDKVESLYNQQMEQLQETFDALEPKKEMPEPNLEKPDPGAARRVTTGVSADRLRELNEALLKFPEDFNINSKLTRLFKRRANALDDYDEPTVDWATAEALALASILADGIAVRLTGEDVGRGTFSHRHAVLSDQDSGELFVPLQALPQAQAAFEIRNSPLTENAAIGFEYGYNIQAPDRLVIWEAQYGDFVNGAQPMIDEFVTSGFAKWGQTPSLVMLLPHGYEGQGPDHSTGRLERFLQAGAEINMRINNCTTAAQYFHQLRRQALLLRSDPLPLIMLTPKSLLRHPLAASPLRHLVEHNWQPFIDDDRAKENPDKIRFIILCTGKIFVDLVSSDYREQHPEIAIIRVEQLYPLLGDELGDMLAAYPNVQKVVWVQEEPKNMGAWSSMKPQVTRIREIINRDWELDYIGRARRASPAEGSAAWHNVNQKALIARAFKLE